MPHNDHAFGRREAPDARDRAFPMRLLLDPLRATFFPRGIADGSIRHYWASIVLDQLHSGTCVGHGWHAQYSAAPIKQTVPLSPFALYREFVAVDEWSDNDHEATAPDADLQLGTSVRAGAKVGQTRGYLQNYLWAETVEDVRAWHLAGFGTVVLGVTWMTGMLEADAEGFLAWSGFVEGGHCVKSTGWSDRVKRGGRRVRALRIQNSWGRAWADKGRAWVEEETVARWIADAGECCAPTEIRIVKPTTLAIEGELG